MQQDQRLTFALFDIVEVEAPQFHELPYGWIVALRLFRSEAIYERRDRKGTITIAAPAATGCAVLPKTGVCDGQRRPRNHRNAS
jgi:hypothetical protein